MSQFEGKHPTVDLPQVDEGSNPGCRARSAVRPGGEARGGPSSEDI